MGNVVEVSEDVLRELYSVSPDEFLQRRTELAEAARTNGDSAAAAQLAKLRKPTVAAWIVNALVNDKPSVVDKLTDLGDALRAAQAAFDAAKLRELSGERRKLVDRLTADAFAKAGRAEPPAALRDEVSGSFDAAVADPEIAARLGRLQRPEQWSGFGFLPTGTPQLTVVKGGKDAAPAKKQAPAKVSAAERRRQERALTKAREAFESADAAFTDAVDAERALQDEVKQLTRRLAKLQGQLDDARAELEQARKDVAAARGQRREARSALDKAEREAPD